MTTLEDAPLREGEQFCDELVKRDFHLGALVLNKTLPGATFGPEGAVAAARAAGRRADGRRRSSPRRVDDVDAAGTGAHDDRRPRSRTSPSSPGARTSSGTSCGPAPTSWSTCRRSPDEIADLGGLARIAAHLAPG